MKYIRLSLTALIVCIIGCKSKSIESRIVLDKMHIINVLRYQSSDNIRVNTKIRNREVLFMANIGGQQMECVLDTGTGWALVPDTLLKAYKDTSFTANISTTKSIQNQKYKVVTTDFFIGKDKDLYRVSNLPIVLGKSRKNTGDKQNMKTAEGLHLPLPLIGNIAFSQSVLSIDYSNHTLEIAASDSSYLKKGLPTSYPISILWHYTASECRYPIVNAEIEGKRYRLYWIRVQASILWKSMTKRLG